jgi:hypothetical protein
LGASRVAAAEGPAGQSEVAITINANRAAARPLCIFADRGFIEAT